MRRVEHEAQAEEQEIINAKKLNKDSQKLRTKWKKLTLREININEKEKKKSHGNTY